MSLQVVLARTILNLCRHWENLKSKYLNLVSLICSEYLIEMWLYVIFYLWFEELFLLIMLFIKVLYHKFYEAVACLMTLSYCY